MAALVCALPWSGWMGGLEVARNFVPEPCGKFSAVSGSGAEAGKAYRGCHPETWMGA
jgi:hypothetical protein